MSLLHKVRTLVGALLHAPFTPRPDKVGLDQPPPQPQTAARPLTGRKAPNWRPASPA